MRSRPLLVGPLLRDAIDFVDQLRQAIGFCQKGRFNGESALMKPARTARCEYDAEIRLHVERSGGEIASISSAKINIREQNIHSLMREDHLGLLSAGRGQDRKPRLLQSFRRDGPKDQFILYHEDAPVARIGELAPVLRLSAPERRDGDHAVRPSLSSPG